MILSLSLLTKISSINTYEIHSVVLQPSIERFRMDFTHEIQESQIFAEDFINGYLSFIQKEVEPDLRNLFELAKTENIATRLILSTSSEAMLCFYPSSKNELIVDCTQYPVQLAVFSELGTKKLENSKRTVEDDINNYKKSEAMFHIKAIFHSMSNFTIRTPNPKVFSFSKNKLILIHNIRVEIIDKDKEVIRSIFMEPICILTGEKDFSFVIKDAFGLGKYIAGTEYRSLIVNSPLFREALVHEHLKKFAIEINQKLSRVGKDPHYEYPLWEFNKDVAQLVEEAKKYGLDTKCVEDLLNYPANKPKDGVLLWYYKDYFGFSLQWTFINAFLFFSYLILKIPKIYKIKFSYWINRLWLKATIIVGINGWIFYVKPEYMPIEYWILPSVPFLACLFIVNSKQVKRE